eukprot:6475443-Amphidinium_carterae.1
MIEQHQEERAKSCGRHIWDVIVHYQAYSCWAGHYWNALPWWTWALTPPRLEVQQVYVCKCKSTEHHLRYRRLWNSCTALFCQMCWSGLRGSVAKRMQSCSCLRPGLDLNAFVGR